jgi:hypothetical protein
MKKYLPFLLLLVFTIQAYSQDVLPFGIKKTERESGLLKSKLEADLQIAWDKSPAKSTEKPFIAIAESAKSMISKELHQEFKTDKIQLLQVRSEAHSQLLQTKSPTLSLEIPLPDNKSVIVDLFEKKPYSHNVIIRTDDGNIHKLADQVHYRGVVRGYKNSVAGISIFEGEFMGVISAAGLGTFNLAKVESHPEYHAIYPEDALPQPQDEYCHTQDEFLVSKEEEEEDYETGELKNNHLNKCVRVYFETDFALYQNKGSNVTNVTNFVNGMFNNVNILLQNEEITSEISEIFIWTSASPYPANVNNALSMFRNTRQGFNGDVAHLLMLAGSGGGVAYLNVLCTNSAFAVSNINSNYQNFPNYSWNIMVITHEIGHNLGSQHTQWCGWPGGAIDNCYATEGNCPPGPPPSGGGTIMSYCHLTSFGINFNNGFGPLPGNRIRQRVGQANCLGQCATLCPGINPAIFIEHTTCGLGNGVIDVDLSGLSGNYTVDIGLGASSNTYFDNLPSGVYTIFILDDAECEYNYEVVINSSTGVDAESFYENTSCGQANGELEVFVYQGEMPLFFDIGMDANSTGIFTDLAAGNYSLIVTDANDCTYEEDIYIAESSEIVAFSFPEPTTCGLDNGSVEFVVYSDGNSHWFDFGNGIFTNDLEYDDLPAGTYFVHIINELNCESFETFEIESSDQPVLTAELIPGSCNQASGSVIANLSTESDYFNLNGNQQSSNVFNGLEAGNYTLIAVDIDGCETSLQFELGTTDSLIASIVLSPANCGQPGSLSVQMANASNFQFNIGEGWQSDPVFNNLAQGNYTVSVTNNEGCEGVFQTTLPGTEAIQLSNSITQTTCAQENGQVIITASGGSGNYTYILNGQTSENNQFINLAAGMYLIQVSDSIGCESSEEIIIQSSENIIADLTIDGTSCGENNGSLIIEIIQGNQPFSFDLGQGAFTNTTVSDLPSGTYLLLITDSNNCSAQYDFTISTSTQITLAAEIQNAVCEEAVGEISLNVQGGTGNYSYFINGIGQEGPELESLLAGEFLILVSDDAGCSRDTVLIIQNEGVKPTADFNVIRNGLEISTVNNSKGGSLEFEWSFGDGNTSTQGEPHHTYEQSGNYQICLIVQNECGRDTLCRSVNAVDLSSCRYRDSLALVALYLSTNGDQWVDSWDLQNPFTTWKGLHFNQDGCLIRLELPGNNLSGILPKELGQLSQLIGMDLSANFIYGTIPAEIGELTALIFLNLANNQLSGDLPEAFYDLVSLQSLELENNQLTGLLPNRIDRLRKLRFVDLSENDFFGDLPSGLYNLMDLEFINLGYNNFSGSVSSEVQKLTKLKRLFLNDNDFHGQIPGTVTDLENLEALWIQNNFFTKLPDLTSLGNWSNSASAGIRVQNNHLTFKDILPNMPVFEELSLSVYYPQRKVFRDTVITVNQGENIQLDIEVDKELEGMNYQWYKGGELSFSFNSSMLDLQNLKSENSGTYIGKLSHPGAPLLQLETYPVTVVVESATSVLNFSDLIQVAIAPNPAVAQGEMVVQLESVVPAQDATLRIYSISGVLVLQSDRYLIGEGNNTLRFKAPAIPGVYLVNIQIPALGSGNFKVVVY